MTTGNGGDFYKDVDVADPEQFRVATMVAVRNLHGRIRIVEGRLDWIIVLLISNLVVLVVNLAMRAWS